MERTFAGFWVDGAVRVPDAKHWSDCKCIFAIQKHDNSLDICLRNFNEWVAVYWLDTTTHTELTPQQAFEVFKTVFPNLHYINRSRDGKSVCVDKSVESIVNWGSLTEYPPRERWRVPTDSDKGKRCRFKEVEENDWIVSDSATFFGVHPNYFVIINKFGVPVTWRFCEVLE